jgi:hypothetical protein
MVRGNDLHEEMKREIYYCINLLEVQIKDFKNKLEEIDNKIIQECIETNGKHDFERERESGPYGESYFVCKQCGYES